jgi:imidazolonepropionase-like amidohydrolase
MRRRDFLKMSALVAAAAACDVDLEPDPSEEPEDDVVSDLADSILIAGARVFDGETDVGRRYVLVRDGMTVEAVEEVRGEVGTRVEGDGATLLPGLIDAHTHTFQAPWLRQSLMFGVTTLVDMFTEPTFAARLRREPGAATDRADFHSSGHLATTPQGHGTQFGVAVPTLTSAAEADAWVEARLGEGSEYIKIIADEWGDGPLDGQTVEALAHAAARHGVLSVAHAMVEPMARLALASGVDGLAHTIVDRSLDRDLLEMAVDGDVFMITTLSVLPGSGASETVLEDERLRGLLHPPDLAHLQEDADRPAPERPLTEVGKQVVADFHGAGLRVLAGTDTRNPGVVHGASMHSELELLVDAGFTPAAALAAATSVPAAVFGLDDRGRIEPGQRADLLLVDGDPLEDITATRAVRAIWKNGVEVDRDATFERLRP